MIVLGFVQELRQTPWMELSFLTSLPNIRSSSKRRSPKSSLDMLPVVRSAAEMLTGTDPPRSLVRPTRKGHGLAATCELWAAVQTVTSPSNACGGQRGATVLLHPLPSDLKGTIVSPIRPGASASL